MWVTYCVSMYKPKQNQVCRFSGTLTKLKVPDELIARLVAGALGDGGWVIGEYPTNVDRAKLLTRHGRVPDFAVELSMAEQDRLDWLSWPRACADCGRGSNRGAFVGPTSCDCGGRLLRPDSGVRDEYLRRLRDYHRHAEQVMSYYRQRSACHSVNVQGDYQETTERLAKLLRFFVGGRGDNREYGQTQGSDG
jgi:adenylate kinase family enzyme